MDSLLLAHQYCRTMQPTTKISIFGFRLATVVLGVYWIAIFTGTHLPKIPQAIPTLNDKAIHFIAYFILTLLMAYTTNSARSFRRFSAIAAIAMIYGAIDELSQGLVPNRTPDLLDYAADVAGICTAIAFYIGAKYLYRIMKLPAKTA